VQGNLVQETPITCFLYSSILHPEPRTKDDDEDEDDCKTTTSRALWAVKPALNRYKASRFTFAGLQPLAELSNPFGAVDRPKELST
jgi:hypothetical protein